MKPIGVCTVFALLMVAGCTTPPVVEEETTEEGFTPPERLNLVADTAGRDIDRGNTMNILDDAAGQSTLIFWVSTGCSGCHDWTEMIADEMRSGNISSETRIVTVHRYPSFESRSEVIETYATENTSTESLWPVLLTYDGQPAIDVDIGEETDYDFAKAFETPATPSFTILDGNGKTIWKNKEYWSDKSVLSEALENLE